MEKKLRGERRKTYKIQKSGGENGEANRTREKQNTNNRKLVESRGRRQET
uniref:Uncharacterized protein n=1 Tax=Cucumis melo TaxID=3656 RepID=A0A9I9D605_CUCME